jgi:hypothetical protein
MPTYAVPPAALVDTYENQITSAATPYEQQIDGGVNQVTTVGMIQVVARTRSLRLVVVGTASYQAIRDFLIGLKGKPFTWGGTNWVATDKSWTPEGYKVWILNLSLVEFFG